jgi:cytochrome c oxidase subunit II
MKRIKLLVIGVRLFVTLGIVVLFTSVGHAAEVGAPPVSQAEQVIHITAKKFEYNPSEIILKKGVPVVLELTSLDRVHGFRLTEFGIRADIKPGEVTRVRLVPQETGRFTFACDVFCGVSHEEMAAEIVVVD